jgi:radical SAM superfamily enzyme YgiQ (UPF0313 family)
MEKKGDKKWLLFRIIIPIFHEVNIFSGVATKTTALGPVMLGTAADKLWGWRVEIIDENNYHGGLRDKLGLPDHRMLQQENPATVVGFFCGLSSTMERVWQLAEFYRQQGVATIAGGWHVHYQSEESLQKDIGIIVHGDGENIIRPLLREIEREKSFSRIMGISFLEEGKIKHTLPERLEIPDLNSLPFPNFGLLKYAKLKIYPIGRTRGCSKGCEFCSVRGTPYWAGGEHLFKTVQWLKETRGAKKFFIVDDRLDEDRIGTLNFFNLVAKEYGDELNFTVQIRLEAAKDKELLNIMKKAGVRMVCIGYESCIDQELIGMRKGYLSTDMIKWTKVFHRFGFIIHGMFIFGYPMKEGAAVISAQERARCLKKFIRHCQIDTIQILHPIPISGSDLRIRMEKEGKLFSLEVVPWTKYDGNYICYRPDNMSLREFQELPIKIMRRFYSPWSLLRIPLKIVYLIKGWQRWYRGWYNDIASTGGYFLIKKWHKRYERQAFLKKLESLK